MVRQFETSISTVEPGRVLIRGYSHEAIMRQLHYQDAAFLTLIGRLPSPAESRLVDAILTSLLDHGWVASTVAAARYVASGNPQFVPAVAGGLLAAGSNTLSPEHSYELLERAIKLHADRGGDIRHTAAAVVDEARAQGRRIPGFGHPVHRDVDFRAEVLFDLAEELGLVGPATTMYRAIHTAFVEATGRTHIPINIDGCLACLGMDLGLSAHQVVAFAMLAVLPGLMAHVIEEIEQKVPLRYIEDGTYIGAGLRELPASDDGSEEGGR
jgi:citrate synthase